MGFAAGFHFDTDPDTGPDTDCDTDLDFDFEPFESASIFQIPGPLSNTAILSSTESD